jgi:hypothetical protein
MLILDRPPFMLQPALIGFQAPSLLGAARFMGQIRQRAGDLSIRPERVPNGVVFRAETMNHARCVQLVA